MSSGGSAATIDEKRTVRKGHLRQKHRSNFLSVMEDASRLSFASWLLIDRARGQLVEQIHAAIRERVLDGRLRPGEALPSSRSLALHLGIARSTVVAGLDRLRAEGFITGRPGSALRVADLPTAPQGGRDEANAPLATPVGPAAPEPERFLAFRPGVPDLANFPHAPWARCLAARARALRIHDLGYGEETGLMTLREAILRHVVRTRAVLADPEQVVVLPSAAAILSLLARLVGAWSTRPFWMEDPGYRIARDVFLAAGARVVPVPCDGEGIVIGSGNGAPPALVYVTPSHQYPTGVAMSLPRRLQLLDFAAATGAIVVEDDYDSEFHYTARPLAALQGIDRSDCVAYVGTFSKVLAPGLRVAYAVLPPRLLEPVRAVLRREGGSVPIHVQAALADFLQEGHLRAQVRRMHAVYAERMRTTRAALEEAGAGWFDVATGDGGLQLATWFRDKCVDDEAMARRLNAQSIGAMALSPFHIGPPRPGLLFGIGVATDERVARLAEAIGAEAAKRRSHRSAPEH